MREFIKKKWQGLLRYLKKKKYIKKTWEIIHSYFEKNNYVKKKWKIILGYATAIVLFAVILSQILDRTMLGPVATAWDKSEWASFLGSYIGGIATLAAVMLQISYSRFEQEQKEIQDQEERYKRSAFIIYYDFDFAKKDINGFKTALTALPALTASEKDNLDMILDNELNTSIQVSISMNIKNFKQLYIDPNWVRNVAELQGCQNITEKNIEDIYSVYGYLSSIKQYIDDNNESSLSRAKNAIKEVNKLLFLEEEDIMETLRKLSGIKKKRN